MNRSAWRRLLNPQYHLAEDELVVRTLFRTIRIPRANVAFAKFEYAFPGSSELWIHLRDGRIVTLNWLPKFSSSELSGDPAQPGSAAYEITEWAGKGTT